MELPTWGKGGGRHPPDPLPDHIRDPAPGVRGPEPHARCPQDPTRDPSFLAQLSQVTLSWMVLSTVTSAAGNFT